MTTSRIANIDEAESAWTRALTSANTEDIRALLHPEFLAVHGPVGNIHNAEQFIADANARPRPNRVQSFATNVRELGDFAVVSCIHQLDVDLVPGLPPFVIQAAATRVWARHDDKWLLAHLQMARRLAPG